MRESLGPRFGPAEAWTSGPFHGARGTFLADVDGDRRADAVAVGSDRVLLRRSDGFRFRPAEASRPGASPGDGAVLLADLTGDGKADMVMVPGNARR